MKESIDLHANGKLLLSGEYLVLAGARALALPVRFGQSIHVEPADDQVLHWVSKENGRIWFSCDIKPESLELISASDIKVAARLATLLNAAREVNPGFLDVDAGYYVVVEADYPLDWGLGGSSTLIALIAGWADIDKFQLFRMVSQGSGYDVACTDRDALFFYQRDKDKIILADAIPGKAITDHACFAYLGRKQETDQEVSTFFSEKNFTRTDIDRVSELSGEICNADDPLVLCRMVDEHENILGRILKKERIAIRFPDFPGSVKSLGAWGGDFAMFASKEGNDFIRNWLMHHGFGTVFSYDEIKVISKDNI